MSNYSNQAMVFPGQGSQHVGMLQDIAKNFNEITETFEEASTALGYDLWHLTQEGPAEKLDQTHYTQPALLTASYALWRILQNASVVQPQILAGHSLGEYTALVCAEVLTFKQAVKLVAARGRYMQEAVPRGIGAMAAIIGLDNQSVADVCVQAVLPNEIAAPANFNSLGQVVISGHKASIENAVKIAKGMGAKIAALIPVSIPSHCQLMLPAANKLAKLLTKTDFHSPKVTVFNNVEAQPYTTPDTIREGLIKQLYSPVRWVEIIQHFVDSGVTTIIECGPGKVLTGLNKRINKNLKLLTTSDNFNLESLLNV